MHFAHTYLGRLIQHAESDESSGPLQFPVSPKEKHHASKSGRFLPSTPALSKAIFSSHSGHWLWGRRRWRFGLGPRPFTAGPITGFGSVIVNGIRFDVSGANVADDEDEVQGEGNLKLGMVAEIGSQVEVRAPCLQTEAGSLRQPLNLSTDRTRQFSRCAGSTHAPRMRRCMTMHCTGVS